MKIALSDVVQTVHQAASDGGIMFKSMVFLAVLSAGSDLTISSKKPPRPPFLPVPVHVDAKAIPAYSIDVLSVSFSKDQKSLMTVGHDRQQGGNLKIWDLESKKRIRTFEAGGTGTEQFLASNAAFVTFAGKLDGWEIRQWDIETGGVAVLHSLKHLEQPVVLWADRKTMVVSANIAD